MEKKSKCVKVGFSRILWTVMAILICTAPCGWAMDITEPIDGPVYPEGEVNVYADITYGLSAQPGSTVNIYAGAIGDGLNYGITVSPDTPYAVVTVYGTAFGGDGDFSVPGQVSFPSGSGTLTVTYDNDTIADLLFWSDIPINLVDTAASGPEEITIDIKPGSYPNSINLGSNGVIPVAILSTADFDATTLNPENIFLAGSGVRVRGKGNKYLAIEEDVNGDDILDLVLKVETVNLELEPTDGVAILKVYDEPPTEENPNPAVLYEGSDEIRIVPPE